MRNESYIAPADFLRDAVHDARQFADLAKAVRRWQSARKVVTDASVYPIGNAAYRAALNELADAEGVLAKADT